MLPGGAGLGARDKPGLDHVFEDLGGTRRCRLAVAGRAEPGGRLQQPGDHRAFEQVELCRRFAEIAMRGRIHAIGAGAEIDPIEIDFENLVLCEAVLEPQGQQRLADLSGETALGRQKQHFGQLLRDRAAALHDVTGVQIGDRGAHQADRIDPEMAVEPAILGRDHRFRQHRRHLRQSQRLPEQVAEGRDRAAVIG